MIKERQKRNIVNFLCLLGVVGAISYFLAAIISPFYYSGYSRIAQAVSDLTADDSTAKTAWKMLSSLHIATLVGANIACIAIKGKCNKLIRTGIYTYTVMQWISFAGYSMFPLSAKGYAGTFQDIMHCFVITALVVILSAISLALVGIGGLKSDKKSSKVFGIISLILLCIMIIGGIGTGILPKEYFGIPERMSIYSTVIFGAVIGIYGFNEFYQ